QAVVSAGIPDEHVMRVIIAFESFLFGSALDVNAPPTIFDASDSSIESAWLQRVVSASMTQQQVERADASHPKHPIDMQNFYADVPFRFGLDALISQTLTLVEP
ncbi:MAG: TetR/AcrR family transcriptional regulator, partial [Yaniella sp.]|nr:TetR/AcrR family transcriptional regulator [Yaniella sp.]